jgi:hypothetical protein
VSFATITLCVTCQQVFIVVSVYFFRDSVRKLLDTPSYTSDENILSIPFLNILRFCYSFAVLEKFPRM